MMNSFIWKDKDSYSDFGIIINKLPPETIPESDVEIKEIEGRDGDLTFDNNAKKSYPLPMECTLMDKSKLLDIKQWLNGYGDLVFNWQSDYRYEARLNNKIDIEQIYRVLGKFQIVWNVQPYKKSISDDLITLTSPGTLYNLTGNTSKPIIKVYGSGVITVTVNGLNIYLTNVNEYVQMDSDIQNANKGPSLQNQNMEGEFALLIPGNNTISWSGTVTKVEITPSWRYL